MLHYILFRKVFTILALDHSSHFKQPLFFSLFAQIFSHSSLLILLTSQTQTDGEDDVLSRSQLAEHWAQSAPTTTPPTKTRGREDRHGGKELLPGRLRSCEERKREKSVTAWQLLPQPAVWRRKCRDEPTAEKHVVPSLGFVCIF